MIIRISDLVLALLIAGLLSFAGGAWWGLHDGAAKTKAKQDSAAVKDLTAIIGTAATLAADANKASTDLRTQTNQRAALDNKTTQELKHALALSVNSRAACRLDAGSMRILEDARDRASSAAASGVLSALPATP